MNEVGKLCTRGSGFYPDHRPVVQEDRSTKCFQANNQIEKMKNTIKSVCALAATLITYGSLAGGANAATLITGTSVISNPITATPSYNIINLTNNSGLSSVGDSDSVIINAGSFSNNFLQTFAETGSYVFDLGAVYTATNMHIWNYSWASSLSRGADSFSYATSTDNISYTSDITGNLAISIGNGSPSDNFALGSDARYVRISLLTSHGDSTYVGLNEVGFSGTAVPEPASAALVGLGCLSLVIRRSRR
jgi:hypothetical protein